MISLAVVPPIAFFSSSCDADAARPPPRAAPPAATKARASPSDEPTARAPRSSRFFSRPSCAVAWRERATRCRDAGRSRDAAREPRARVASPRTCARCARRTRGARRWRAARSRPRASACADPGGCQVDFELLFEKNDGGKKKSRLWARRRDRHSPRTGVRTHTHTHGEDGDGVARSPAAIGLLPLAPLPPRRADVVAPASDARGRRVGLRRRLRVRVARRRPRSERVRPAASVRDRGRDDREGVREGEARGQARVLLARGRRERGRGEVRVPSRASLGTRRALRGGVSSGVGRERPGRSEAARARVEVEASGTHRAAGARESGRGREGPRERVRRLRPRDRRRGRGRGRSRAHRARRHRDGRSERAVAGASRVALPRARRRGQDARAARGRARARG